MLIHIPLSKHFILTLFLWRWRLASFLSYSTNVTANLKMCTQSAHMSCSEQICFCFLPQVTWNKKLFNVVYVLFGPLPPVCITYYLSKRKKENRVQRWRTVLLFQWTQRQEVRHLSQTFELFTSWASARHNLGCFFMSWKGWRLKECNPGLNSLWHHFRKDMIWLVIVSHFPCLCMYKRYAEIHWFHTV